MKENVTNQYYAPEITLHITEEDITQGIQEELNLCPIALSADRCFGMMSRPEVTNDSIKFCNNDGLTAVYHIPTEGRRLIKIFDKYGATSVSPCTIKAFLKKEPSCQH